ncbi:bud emergence protein 1 [Mortierella polycephala]|uniref:Bud emergence protein 1 n=1 Tax=Mortierella polycephala TaxID=41804 RepID=A0A9P6U0Q9_9FUNG|nr:bud emergence protein 1 [Mortierella polycephala]
MHLRRSLQNKTTSGPLSPTRAPAAALAPPRKVIRALYDYSSQQAEELSFVKGDFFHVVGNEDDEDWYEACNPVSGARGYVPVTYFQTLEKSGGGGATGFSHSPTQQARHHQQQRDSNQSLEDTDNESGFFEEDYTSPYSPYNNNNHHSPVQQHRTTQHGHSHSNGGHPATVTSPVMTPKTKFQPLYGIVQYDFGAERPDELDCKAGDAILVIAQSNEEWYVAKPIGRLGGPGLIPVSFIEIRDMVTGKPINVPELLRKTGTSIPRVEEWKKQTMEYKANSIPLGRLEALDHHQPQQQPPPQQQHSHHSHQQAHPHHQQMPHGMNMHPQQFHQHQQQQQQQNTGQTIQQLKNKLSRGDLQSPFMRDPGARRNHSQDLDMGRRVDGYNGRATAGSVRSFNDIYEDEPVNNSPSRIVHASVESFHHEDDQYWFTVRVGLASGTTRNLFRLYEDFYNFHIALLEEFPVESGRVGDQPRILPFMPIPLQTVDDEVSASRRTDLDGYVQDLFRLPSRITLHPLVEQLFAVKDGDIETPSTVTSGPLSPGLGRSSNPSNHGHYSPSPVPGQSRESDRRPSTTGGPRAGLNPRAPGHGQGQGQGQRSYGEDPPSGGASPSLRSQSQFMRPGTPGAAPAEDMIKVKISYQEDIMAMRIPVAISFRALQQKIFERLHEDSRSLSYRDDRGDFAPILNDADVREAMNRSGGKLMIYVD